MCRLGGVLNGALASNGDGDGEESVGGERDGSKRQVDARLSQIHNSNTLLDRDPGTLRRASLLPASSLAHIHCTLRPLNNGSVHQQQLVVCISRQLLSTAGARVVRALS